MRHSPRHPADHGAAMFRPPRPPATHLPVVADVPDFSATKPISVQEGNADSYFFTTAAGKPQHLPAHYSGPLVN